MNGYSESEKLVFQAYTSLLFEKNTVFSRDSSYIVILIACLYLRLKRRAAYCDHKTSCEFYLFCVLYTVIYRAFFVAIHAYFCVLSFRGYILITSWNYRKILRSKFYGRFVLFFIHKKIFQEFLCVTEMWCFAMTNEVFLNIMLAAWN